MNVLGKLLASAFVLLSLSAGAQAIAQSSLNIEKLKGYQASVESYIADSTLLPPAGVDLGNAPTFQCDSTRPDSCEMQQFLESGETGRDPERMFFQKGKLKVYLYFNNNGNFPKRPLKATSYQGVPDYETEQVTVEIFKTYLGENYALYEPELEVVTTQHAGITVYLSTADELQRFADDEKLAYVYHGGTVNDIVEHPGGGIMPKRSTIDGSIIEENN